MNVPNKIIVHHTASGGNYTQFLGVNRYHRDRNFEESTLGWFVGYHYFIEKNGDVILARQESDKGQHTTGENLTSIGICLAGNFDIEYPTEAQKKELAELIDDVLARHKIAPHAIYPHRKFANKSCYGSNLSDDWARVLYIQYKYGWISAQLERILGMLRAMKK